MENIYTGKTLEAALEAAEKEVDGKTLLLIHKLKTGALIKSAVLMGCYAAGADDVLCNLSEKYAEEFGFAFQIIDDILDFDGNCYAFGVILDGIVNNDGNNARGSRYNSTKAYTEWVRDVKYPGATILGVVKSEDGMMDIFDETKGSKSADKPLKAPRFLKNFQKIAIDILGHL